MIRKISIFTACLLCFAAGSPSAIARLVVEQWSLGSGILDNSPNGGQATTFFSVVENPFKNSQTATHTLSYLTTSYDFSWADDSGSFDTISHQQAAQLYGKVATSDTIYFTPSTDSALTFSIVYSYNWPNSVLGLAGADILVYDFTLATRLLSLGREGGNIGLDPPHGKLQIANSVSLIAGHDYEFIYETEIQQDNASPPGTIGTADADINFTIAPIPEPASVGFVVLCALIFRRHNSSRL